MNISQAAAARRAIASGIGSSASRRLGDITKDSFFQYSIAYTFITGLDNFNNVIQILSDAHFLCMSTAYTNTLEVGNTAVTTAVSWLRIQDGGAVIQLTDGGTQRQLQNIQVPVCSLFGSGELPHVWEFTHLFRANTQIGINITGIGAAVAGQVIRLIFTGMKIPVGSVPTLEL